MTRPSAAESFACALQPPALWYFSRPALDSASFRDDALHPPIPSIRAPMPLKRRLGIIDLGSNSARLVIAHYTPGHAFRIVEEHSRRVRLSEGMSAGRHLQPEAVGR